MSIIPDKEREMLKKVFDEQLTKPLKILFFTKAIDCETCQPTEQILTEVASLSDKIELVVKNIITDKDDVEKYGIKLAPSTVILGEGDVDYNIRITGIPAGYEFTSLIEVIRYVGSDLGVLAPETEEFLGRIADRDVELKIFVQPTCPHCPEVVRLGHLFALKYKNIRAEMIEIQEFPDLAEKYAVSSVPKTVINEEAEFAGAVPEVAFAAMIVQAIDPKLIPELDEMIAAMEEEHAHHHHDHEGHDHDHHDHDHHDHDHDHGDDEE